MTNKTKIILNIIVIILVIFSLYFFTNNTNKDTISLNEEVVNKFENTIVDGFRIVGSYEPYSDEKVAQRALLGKVVLFFRASWCPECRALDKDIKANLENIPANLTILDVDYDNSGVLKRKYGVTHQHTLVEVDKNGEMVQKWLGSPTLVKLISKVK